MNKVLFVILSSLLFSPIAKSNPCTEDIKKFCLSSRQDKNAMAKCLFENKNNLNEDCREKMDSARGKVQKLRSAIKDKCQTDIDKHCANLDGQDLKRCIEVKKGRFEKGCQNFLTNNPATSGKKKKTKAQ